MQKKFFFRVPADYGAMLSALALSLALTSRYLTRFYQMATKQIHTTDAAESQAETMLREALAKMKAASDRHAAIVAATSRLGVSAQERRLAQSESKKVDHELNEAKRLLRDAQAAVRTAKVRGTR